MMQAVRGCSVLSPWRALARLRGGRSPFEMDVRDALMGASRSSAYGMRGVR